MSEKSPKNIKNTCKTNIYKFRANSKKAQQVNPSPFKSAQVPWTYFSGYNQGWGNDYYNSGYGGDYYNQGYGGYGNYDYGNYYSQGYGQGWGNQGGYYGNQGYGYGSYDQGDQG